MLKPQVLQLRSQPCPIDIGGLNPEDIHAIRTIGFWKWINKIADDQEKRGRATS